MSLRQFLRFSKADLPPLIIATLTKAWVIILYLLLAELGASPLHRGGPREATHIVDAIVEASGGSFISAPSRV